MLDTHLIEHLITQYLQSGLDHLEAKAYGRSYKPGEIKTSLDSPVFQALKHLQSPGISRRRADRLQQSIATKNVDLGDYTVQTEFEPLVKNKYGKPLLKAEKYELAIRVLHADRQLADVEAAVMDGRYEVLELLQEKIQKSRPYLDLATVIKRYEEKYRTDKGQLKPRADKQLTVDLNVILEIFGNVSIDTVNLSTGFEF